MRQSASPRLRALLLTLVLTATLLVPAAASAVSSDLVIRQVYGGGGNSGATYTHDFVELFNAGSSPVSITGWSVQYASATGTTWSRTALSGTVQPGQSYLVQQAAGTGGTTPLPTPDAAGTIAMSATAGKVILSDANVALTGSCPTAGIVDLVGYGSTANCSEGSGPTPTLSNTTAAHRAGDGCTDTDSNAADFTVAAPTPRNSASPLSPCGPTATPLSASGSADPTDVTRGGTTLLQVAVTPASSPASTGIAVTADLSGLGGSTTQSLLDDGTQGDLAAGDGTFSYLATVPADAAYGARSLPFSATDAQGRAAAGAIAVTVSESCGDTATRIHTIQGSGTTSPVVNQVRTIEGVVVGDYQLTPAQFGGFFVQEEDADADGDATTSEGIFVALATPDVAVGDVVRVRGTVRETSNLTLMNGATVLHCGTTATVTPTDVLLPAATSTWLERFEGMSVRFPQRLTVTEVFTLGRFGEVDLAVGGRLFTPTNVVAPGPAAIEMQAQNDLRRILLDDGDNRQNVDPTRYPGAGLSAANTLRVGDTTATVVGVLDQRFNRYRVQPVATTPTFDVGNPRPATPPAVGGTLRVASMNVLNYFTTLDTGQAICGPTGGMGCRGADNAAEFERQRAKIVAAITAMDAHVVGLMELENDPGATLADLVAGLNDATAPGTYAYVDTGTIGTDAIKVGLVYQPAVVTPVGAHAILDATVDPRFDDTRSRPVLAQTFAQVSDGARLTIAVNHLKSKGSACAGDPDRLDGQGNCNLTRTRAAEALADWLAKDPTGSGDADRLIIGDLNAYAKEDPITALVAAGYRDEVARHGTDPYGYVFGGQSGYLDHALASPTLSPQVTGVRDWHINADEPVVLDYNTEFKSAGHIASLYAPTPFRSSDHDPVLIGLALRAYDAVVTGPLAGPGVRSAKAGQAVPIELATNGSEGADLVAAAPTTIRRDCATGASIGTWSAASSASPQGFTFDATAATWTFPWKTTKSWAGQCRRVSVTLTDGRIVQADVRFDG